MSTRNIEYKQETDRGIAIQRFFTLNLWRRTLYFRRNVNLTEMSVTNLQNLVYLTLCVLLLFRM